MKTDLFSAEKKENQPAPHLVKTAGTLTTPLVEKKRSKFRLIYLAFGLLVFLLFALSAWVGYWAYDLSTELVTTQQQLTALQGKYDQLQADYTTLTGEHENLNADLTQAKADFEKMSAELAAAQTNLTKSQEQNRELTAKLKKAGKLAEILYLWTTMDGPSDVLAVDRLITETRHQTLMKEWDQLTSYPSEFSFTKFLDTLILAARNSLK